MEGGRDGGGERNGGKERWRGREQAFDTPLRNTTWNTDRAVRKGRREQDGWTERGRRAATVYLRMSRYSMKHGNAEVER